MNPAPMTGRVAVVREAPGPVVREHPERILLGPYNPGKSHTPDHRPTFA